MGDEFSKGVALIFEGDTEKVFYLALLQYFCSKHPGSSISKHTDQTTGEVFYSLDNGTDNILIKTNIVGTISQVTNSGAWFSSRCHSAYKNLEWTVVLCYDTDEYLSSYSKFQEGDWKDLRKSLKRSKAKTIIDMASNADIEDTMLLDINGVFSYLEMPVSSIPSGSKGKRKMKKLFRLKGPGVAYHEGERAKGLIDALDFRIIMSKSKIPFAELERVCFPES